MRQMTGLIVGRILRNAALSHPDKVGLVDFEKPARFTFREINERVNKAACALRDLGLRKNDVVCLLLRNCSEFIEAALAVMNLGAIAAPLNYRLSPREVKELVAFSGAK